MFGQLRFGFILIRRISTASLALHTCSGFRLCGRRRALFGRRIDFLESSGNHRGFSFCASAIRLGKTIPRETREKSNLTLLIDAAAIYLATVYPFAFWMTSLPRNFNWFVENDFFVLPAIVETIFFPVYVLALIAYFGKSIYLYFTDGFLNIGKDIVVLATTAVCWYVGIVFFNSDYAFTVTNVIIHGVPYFALIYFYAKSRRETADDFYKSFSSNWIIFLASLWALAYVEELVWNRGVWHEKNWLFGASWNLDDWKMYLVPLSPCRN